MKNTACNNKNYASCCWLLFFITILLCCSVLFSLSLDFVNRWHTFELNILAYRQMSYCEISLLKKCLMEIRIRIVSFRLWHTKKAIMQDLWARQNRMWNDIIWCMECIWNTAENLTVPYRYKDMLWFFLSLFLFSFHFVQK